MKGSKIERKKKAARRRSHRLREFLGVERIIERNEPHAHVRAQ
jgi:hypothetical protein